MKTATAKTSKSLREELTKLQEALAKTEADRKAVEAEFDSLSAAYAADCASAALGQALDGDRVKARDVSSKQSALNEIDSTARGLETRLQAVSIELEATELEEARSDVARALRKVETLVDKVHSLLVEAEETLLQAHEEAIGVDTPCNRFGIPLVRPEFILLEIRRAWALTLNRNPIITFGL